MDNRKDKGYENPYNPWKDNIVENNIADSFDNSNEEDNSSKQNMKVAKKIVSLVKFIKTVGLRTLLATTFTWAIFSAFSDYALVIDLNKYVFADYDKGKSYSKIFLVIYIIFVIIYYKYKYFNKKKNIFALLGFLISISLFAVLPFMVNLKYSTDRAVVNNFISKKTFMYKDITQEVKVSMRDFDYSKSINLIEGTNFSFVFTKDFNDDDDEDFLDVAGVTVETLKDFKEVESNLTSAKKIRYFLDADTVQPKEVTKDEFYKNIEKYKPYNDFSKDNRKQIMQNSDAFNWYDKWIIDLIVK